MPLTHFASAGAPYGVKVGAGGRSEPVCAGGAIAVRRVQAGSRSLRPGRFWPLRHGAAEESAITRSATATRTVERGIGRPLERVSARASPRRVPAVRACVPMHRDLCHDRAVEDVVFLAVVGGRFLLPLLIPRFPLPAIIACLVLDAADQTIFQAFGFDPPGYQNYDKAMDIFYLSIAYLAAMRNWDNLHAFAVARFLFYYRLVGAFLFEVTHERWLLLVFPNTFEYFFIAYELWRTRWRTRPVTAARLDHHGGVHLDLHQAAAGVLAARRGARRDRHARGLLVGVAAADLAARAARRDPVVRRTPAAARARPPLPDRLRPDPGRRRHRAPSWPRSTSPAAGWCRG